MSLYDTIMAIAPDRKIEHIALAIIRNPTGQPSMAPRGSSFVGMKAIRNIDIKMKRSMPMMPDAMTFAAILYVRFKLRYPQYLKRMIISSLKDYLTICKRS